MQWRNGVLVQLFKTIAVDMSSCWPAGNVVPDHAHDTSPECRCSVLAALGADYVDGLSTRVARSVTGLWLSGPLTTNEQHVCQRILENGTRDFVGGWHPSSTR